MASPRISAFFFALGLVAATMGLLTYGLGFWLTSDANNNPAGGISMIFGVLSIVVAGLSLMLSLVAKIWECARSEY